MSATRHRRRKPQPPNPQPQTLNPKPQVGDGVVGVNGENVVGLAVAEIRERIVGPIGSTVRVTFARNDETFERQLMRGNAQIDGTGGSNGAAAASLSRSLDAR
jgi:hypothetical protein